MQFGMSNAKIIALLITGGVAHRFPDLKFVSVESGVGWRAELRPGVDMFDRDNLLDVMDGR
jgi:hypothetical protein